MQTQKINWSAVLLMVLFGLGVLIHWGITTGIAITSIPTLFEENADTAAALILAAATGLQGLLLLAAGLFAFFKIIGREIADKEARIQFANWHIPVILLISAAAILAGSSLKDKHVLSLFLLPILTLIATVGPLWLYMGFGTRQIELGPRWRAWGIFGLAMTLGPLIMMFLEVALGIAIIFGVLIYFLATNPAFANQLIQFSSQLQTMSSPEQALNVLLPYALNPATMIVVLGYTAVAVPMIEEIFKPIGVWLFASQFKSAKAGFVMGILSGTAYALVENLGTTVQAGSDWTMIVSARAATGLLHVTTTGLMGWAIVSLWNERKYLRFFASYLSAIALHGLWNSAGVSFAFYAAAEALGKGKSYLWFAVAGTLLMGSLVIVLLIILITSNRVAKESITTEALAQQEIVQP